MTQNLTALEKPMFKIFSDDYLFTIPPVQRPYTWTTEQAGDLLNDLVDYIDRNNITPDNLGRIDEPYFLGSLVLINQDKQEKTLHEILDGQQRLTTLTILLAVLRDYLPEQYAKSIKKFIVQEGDLLLQTKDKYRLELRKKDRHFFRKYIQEDKATHTIDQNLEWETDSQRLIKENALFYSEELNNLPHEVVMILPSVISTLCYMVVVTTYNFDSAFRIFTVLNNRGLDLKESDIFKARAIGEDIDLEEQDDYTAKWEDVEIALGRDNFNKLFDHIRMIVQKRKGGANLKDEYEKIFSNISGKEFIDDYLIPYGDIFLNLLNYHSYYQGDPDKLKTISLLNHIDNVDWVPAAMFYIRRKLPDVDVFLEKLEAFAASAMILRRNYNWRMANYANVLREIDKLDSSNCNLDFLDIDEKDKASILQALGGDVYTDLKASAVRYVLLKLDSLLTTGQPYYDYSVITVEHVLPQNPAENSEWKELFSNPEEYVHKLGNLVLLTRRKNSQARNFDFKKKKDAYFKSNAGATAFALTSQVIQESEWTPDIIKKRQEELITLLITSWKL